MTTESGEPTQAELVAYEQLAVELARISGAEIVHALGRTLSVRYKSLPDDDQRLRFRDPVSEVDSNVEAIIRARLAQDFPDHGILGEEVEDLPATGKDVVWAVDPIDGTTNFVNGFPLYAASIGVLHRGVPVAGAIWCSVTHALRAGVYHARRGGALTFEDEPIEVRANPAVRRRLAGAPDLAAEGALGDWDLRKTGSAAIECAFVAAGLLEVAAFRKPNVWDVAAGLCLVQAAGGVAFTGDRGDWAPFERFTTPLKRYWGTRIILGAKDAATVACERASS